MSAIKINIAKYIFCKHLKLEFEKKGINFKITDIYDAWENLSDEEKDEYIQHVDKHNQYYNEYFLKNDPEYSKLIA